MQLLHYAVTLTYKYIYLHYTLPNTICQFKFVQ